MEDPIRYDTDEGPARFFALVSEVTHNATPMEIWVDGTRVAVMIHPEEFDLLNRLVKET